MISLLQRSQVARRMLLARSLSVWGDTFYAMAAMWVTLEVTGSPWRMALIALAEVLPYLLFSAVAGALVDRWDRRRVLVTLDLVQGAVVAALPVLYISGWFSPWLLPVVGFIHATCRTLYGPALASYYPSVVDKADLPALLGLQTAALRSGSVVVPLLLGLFFERIDLVPAFLLDAATFFISALLLRSLPAAAPAASTRTERGNLRQEIRHGMAALRHHRLLLLAMVTCMVGSLVRAPLYRFALPILATGALQAGDDGYRFLQLAQGLGGVGGAILAGYLVSRISAYVPAAMWGWALSGAGTLLAGLGPLLLGTAGLVPAMLGLALSALGPPVAYTATNVSMQTEVQGEHVGKVAGLFATLDMSGDYGGVLLMPLWLTWFDVEAILATGGLLTVLFCLAAYMQAVRPVRPIVPNEFRT